MKQICGWVVMAFAVAMTGCAATGDYYAAVRDSNAAQVQIAQARASAETARVKALSDLAASGDSAGRVAAAMALALGGERGGQVQALVPSPMQSEALQWASVLAPAVTNLGLGVVNAATVRHQASMSRDVAVSSNAAFSSLGGQIGAAGVAGYPYVRSSMVTTNNSTSNAATTTSSTNAVNTSTVSSMNSVGDYSGAQSGISGQIGNRSDSTHTPTVVVQPAPVVVTAP